MNKGSGTSTNPKSIFEPISQIGSDDLGRLQFARLLLERVSELDCPSTIGLYGGWGEGKTSILFLIQALNERKKSDTIAPIIKYVDVWPYEISGDLTIPLLAQLRNLIEKKQQADYSTYWRRVVGVLAQAGTDVLLRKVLDLELGDVEQYANRLKETKPDGMEQKYLKNLVDDIEQTKTDFQKLVDIARESNQGQRLVFLVDNLDRCSPENVVRLLESAKNFLDSKNCTWVFAMDSGVIASYIDRKYEGTKMDGNSYLDKIIPEQFHIPPISGQDMARLIPFLSRARPDGKLGLPSIDLLKIPQLPEVLVPRRLLKTAHRFYRAYATDSKLGPPASPDVVFALILLYNSWPSFYERFSSDSPEHVHGILANFIPKEQNSHYLIPLPQRFLNDRSLGHYVHQCFIKGQNLEEIHHLLAGSMAWLREVGLP